MIVFDCYGLVAISMLYLCIMQQATYNIPRKDKCYTSMAYILKITKARPQNVVWGGEQMGVELTQAEEALLKTGALQDAILNSANFSSIATDAKGVIQIFNIGAERMLGYAAADVINKITPADISDPQEVILRSEALSIELGVLISSGFEALVFKASRGIEDIYELTYIRKDGSRFPAVVSVTALRDADGAIIGYLLIGTDNTARKRAEEIQKLLERSPEATQKQYGAITEQNIAAVYVVQDGMFSYVNEAFVKVSGYDSADEIMNQIPISNFILPTEQTKVYEIIRKRLSGEVESAHYETVFLRKDGTQVIVEIHGAVGEYNYKPAIIGMLIDKTVEKKAEVFRNLLLSSLGDGVFGIDSDGKTTFVNDAALAMLGYEMNEVVGFDQHELFHHRYQNLEPYPKSECPIYKTIVDGVTRDEEEVFIRKNGEYFPVHLRVAPMMTLDTITGAVVVFQDVTERKILEENLRLINTNLSIMVKEETDKRVENEKLLIQQSKMAMMGEMIGAIAHQWRQPLNSLGMTIQDVEMAYKFNELDEKYIATFKKDAMAIIQSMSVTIEDFRNFFSPNKKQEEFFVEDAVNDILKIMASQLRINSVEVIFDSEKSSRHKYMGYKNELKQVLLNILANAKDALLEVRRDSSFIKIDIDEDDKSLTISIEDSAGGIPENVIDKIFDPYFTTKSADKGTGIGLYMSKEIVESSLNGKLGVTNTQNGARFTMELLKA
jgi:PAS domain S-box-containing protein